MRAAWASGPAKAFSVADQMRKTFLGMLSNEAQEVIRGLIMKPYMPGNGVQTLS